MTFFVDATVVLAAGAAGEPLRDPCLRLLDAVARGAAGRTSAAVLAEIWQAERAGRTGAADDLAEHAHRIFTPLLPVTDEAFARALARGAAVPGLDVADLLHAGTCLAHGIETIVSLNPAFDALDGLRRVDPAHAGALAALLGDHPGG